MKDWIKGYCAALATVVIGAVVSLTAFNTVDEKFVEPVSNKLNNLSLPIIDNADFKKTSISFNSMNDQLIRMNESVVENLIVITETSNKMLMLNVKLMSNSAASACIQEEFHKRLTGKPVIQENTTDAFYAAMECLEKGYGKVVVRHEKLATPSR